MPWHICVLCIIWAALCLELLVFILSSPSVHQSAKFTRSFKVSWVPGERRPSLPCQTHTRRDAGRYQHLRDNKVSSRLGCHGDTFTFLQHN